MPDGQAMALSWRKSTASGTGECVEVAVSSESVLVRDSKQGFPNILKFTSREWCEFVSGVRAGIFDLSSLETSGAPGRSAARCVR
jgi:hypothetical protein